MRNPFKYGTIVEDEFFTDRKVELQQIMQTTDSENHLILISPRRFGKSNLITKAVKLLKRPYIIVSLTTSCQHPGFGYQAIERSLQDLQVGAYQAPHEAFSNCPHTLH